ncbi:hypothetical protein M5K25_019979 [Dendrobium thyrsiflorum]|uniref:Uncharacterized protein n=1 Tax=Dendrobium thyrsiflorum TaxID=117978 RepID=A0ABD0UGN0_DENTH
MIILALKKKKKKKKKERKQHTHYAEDRTFEPLPLLAEYHIDLEFCVARLKLPVLPFIKPNDYVDVLAEIHEELKSCLPLEESELHSDVLGRLLLRSLRSASEQQAQFMRSLSLEHSINMRKKGEEPVTDLLASYRKWKCSQQFSNVYVMSEIPVLASGLMVTDFSGEIEHLNTVFFRKSSNQISASLEKISGWNCAGANRNCWYGREVKQDCGSSRKTKRRWNWGLAMGELFGRTRE